MKDNRTKKDYPLRGDKKGMPLFTNPDYIAIKRHEYSLIKLLERYPEVTPDKVIAQALLIPEESVEVEYTRIVLKLRDLMGVGPS